MKLNLGCGGYPLDGFTNVDAYPPADVVGDFLQMSFEDVDEVVMTHVLEHLPWRITLDALKLIRSWMVEGGAITIEVPDIGAILQRGLYDEWAELVMYGVQSNSGEFHRAAFTLDKLAACVRASGFQVENARAFNSEHEMRRGMACIEVIGVAV